MGTILRALILLAVMGAVATARDDGRYANSEVDWDTDTGAYRVRIDDEWWPVPPDAVITEPNRLGYATVWYWRENGQPRIRCFLPGSGI